MLVNTQALDRHHPSATANVLQAPILEQDKAHVHHVQQVTMEAKMGPLARIAKVFVKKENTLLKGLRPVSRVLRDTEEMR